MFTHLAISWLKMQDLSRLHNKDHAMNYCQVAKGLTQGVNAHTHRGVVLPSRGIVMDMGGGPCNPMLDITLLTSNGKTLDILQLGIEF